MKSVYMILLGLIILSISCNKEKDIVISNEITSFNNFPSEDSLYFTTIHIANDDTTLYDPNKIYFWNKHLIIQNSLNGEGEFIALYSLDSNKTVNTLATRGNGPDDFLDCKICIHKNSLWMYDMLKNRISSISLDSILAKKTKTKHHILNKGYYYSFEMLNDSILLGTNNVMTDYKISIENINTLDITQKGEYGYYNKSISKSALNDATKCYINTNPQCEKIVLSYRYTDIIEIFNLKGEIKHTLHGPECFDIMLRPIKNRMKKSKKTKKAFVSTYTTEKNIYLLYSGSKRNEENWSYGTQLFVYSWDGIPLKRYFLNEPIYTFAIDETNKMMYSYSILNDNFLKVNL